MTIERLIDGLRAVLGRGRPVAVSLIPAVLVLLTLQPALALAGEWPVQVESASDGALLLRDVHARQTAEGLAVSGRIQRAKIARRIAGRVLEIRVQGADGAVRARHTVAVDVARLPRQGGAGQRFATVFATMPEDTGSVVVAVRPGPPAD